MKEKILHELKSHKNEYVSGEKLSGLLGISRAAVSKHMSTLKADGAVIESKKNNGHKLILPPDRLKKEYIVPNINSKLYKYHYKETTGSTNEDLKQDASNLDEISIYACDRQTKGKGRRGREWDSQKYKGIYFSILLKPDIPIEKSFIITCIFSLAIVKTIKECTSLDAKIKWPNDILIGQKKVCGMLSELSSDFDGINHIICGIGINANHELSDFPEELSKKATSLSIECGGKINRTEFFSKLIDNIIEGYYDFIKLENNDFIDEYKKNSIVLNKKVKVYKGNQVLSGEVVDINKNGELILKTKDELLTIFAGEVSVRGENGYV